jgi:hypothetical protein
VSNAVPALPEVGLELSVLLNDISIISSEVKELVFTRCCTARGGGNSVKGFAAKTMTESLLARKHRSVLRKFNSRHC